MTDSSFRLGYAPCLAHLRERVREPAPSRIQLLVGPRQVGKTTLLLELAVSLGPAARYTAMDGPWRDRSSGAAALGLTLSTRTAAA